uniref:Uncharacterized protein n=1 Tax=Tanacetum cinerariifolium TaxID=118510 RepID=A0A6L2P984_TANCI|nr:hypothetical protein [Tanacetum cinerariifolium]
MAYYYNNTADLANLGKEAFDDIDTFFPHGCNSKHLSAKTTVVPPTRTPQPQQVFHYHRYQPQQAYVVQQQVYHDAQIAFIRTERMMKAGFLDSGGGGGKKKFRSGLDSCSTPLVDVTGTIHMGTGSNGSNGDVNDGTVPSVSVDSWNAVKEVVSPIMVDETMAKEDKVKLHGVPVTAFSEDDLSAIATKLESTKEVSKSNPFEVLISVDNDVDLERQIREGKLRFVDDDRNPLVPTGIVDSDSKVEVVFDETINLRLSASGKEESDKGYGTNSLLKQWKDSYPDNDDDDMSENHDMSEHFQFICDDLDITVRGRKKK